MGMVSFDSVASAGWFQVAAPLHFGISFEPSACVSLAIVYVVNAVQTMGDLSSTTLGGMDRLPTDRELSGGIIGQGVISILGAFVGGLPTATYSQNVGIVTVNRVINRLVFTLAAAGRPMSAEEAKALGLAYKVTTVEELDEVTLTFARKLAAGPLISYKNIKKQLYDANYADYKKWLSETEVPTQHECSASMDFQEGCKAFMEKRKATFEGR